ncbi:MAG: hypothetical protein Q8O48_01665, partial [Anaerolineales bacterium]|nr:hypothetical protein [Anaerolineales bacterium]
MDNSKEKRFVRRHFMIVTIAVIAVFVFMAITTWSQPVHALPEYAERTDESCATCHVNPGGGGPRTLRGA